jgi:glycosyltransferase involved in cell wall biosynthesis
MRYSIIIPAYNEETRIGFTIRDYATYIQAEMNPDETEIWIIVNGSFDRTGEIAHEMEHQFPFVHVWESEEKMGKGGAVMQGFGLAQGEIVAFTDADNATVAPELRKLFTAVEQGADAAIGSRWLPGSVQKVPQPLSRRFAGRVFNLIVRSLFQLSFRDTQCGAKAFRREAIRQVLPWVRSTGWAFDVELIWRLLQNRFRVLETPIVWSDNSHSRLRMHRDAPSMLWELIKLRISR